MIAVAPSHVITIFQPDDARVVAVLKLDDFVVVAFPFDGGIFQFPVNSILAEAAVQVHVALFIVTAKNTGKLALKRHNRAVEDAVCRWDQVAWNDGIGAVAPNYLRTTGWSFFPGDIL